MLSPGAVISPNWQNLQCMQNVAGKMESYLTAIQFFATSFLHIHHAGTANGLKDFILCFEEMHLNQVNKQLICLQRCFK